jgi:hypothetical protein
MIRRVVLVLSASVLLAAFALSTKLPAKWRSWRYSRPVQIQPGPSSIFCSVPLRVDLFPHSQNHLADLRLIDDTGAEVPYSLNVQNRPGQPESRPATLRENSFVPGQYTQLLLDLGKKAAFHNAVQMQTSESDFINWVEIAASDDARIWRIVKARAPISRFRRENLEGNQTIRYSQNNARYLRLRIFESQRQFPVSGANIYFNNEAAELPREPLPATLVSDAGAPSTESRWTADFGSAQFPIAEVSFRSSQPEFYRAVRVLTSEDGKEWMFHGGGEIYRYKVGEKLEESVRVPLDNAWGPRYWRVEIVNANDSPLQDVSPSFMMTSHALFFEQKPGHTYRLLYDQAGAAAPQYDFDRVFGARMRDNDVVLLAPLGPEEVTANYADPRPFTERHPNLLWLALGLAVAVIAYSALRALRTQPTSPQAQ